VRRGLTGTPKSLPPKWFYDESGSALFDEITRLPEYYPTRTERLILEQHADEVARITTADTLIELGSGTSEKTRLLLDAGQRAGTLRRFVPFDVDPVVLANAAADVRAAYPGLTVEAVVGDFEQHLHALPAGRSRVVAFLGSTIGNLDLPARTRFYRDLRAALRPGDHLLLGTDLVKDPARLVAAYDDAAGVTAAFNRNVLHVVNRELGADFNVTSFAHVALWDPQAEWVEMRLESLTAQQVRLADLGLLVDFAAGEQIRTEISAKFRRAGVEGELVAAGFRLRRWWTDPAGDFAVSLSAVEPEVAGLAGR